MERGSLLKDETSCTNTLGFLPYLKRRLPDTERLMLISVTNLSLFFAASRLCNQMFVKMG